MKPRRRDCLTSISQMSLNLTRRDLQLRPEGGPVCLIYLTVPQVR